MHLLLHPKKSIAFYHITPSERDDIDAVVNSNVLFHFGRDRDTEPVIAFLLDLLRMQRETSSDKWCENLFVIWYFFSRALRRAAVDAGDAILGRLRAATPSTLERALAACAQLDWSERPDDEAINAIIDAQLPSGAWPLAPSYKRGPVRWGPEELTTGPCIEALSRWYRKGK